MAVKSTYISKLFKDKTNKHQNTILASYEPYSDSYHRQRDCSSEQ